MTQTVLAIDDSPEIHELLELRLATEGLRLLHAMTAEDGLEIAKLQQPDIILLDILLPGMTGYQLCKQLKEDPNTAHVPVIFLSGASDTFNKVQGLDLGAVDYVTKPFEPAELQARVRAALRTKRYEDLLTQRARIDALTGLHNRAYFDARLSEEIAAASRYGRTVSLLLVDLDHFKLMNDRYGHPFGDRVLQSVGEVLMESARATDAACRYGGDEFAMILGETPLEGAVVYGERVLERLATCQWKQRTGSITITASAGLACSTQLPEFRVTPLELVDAADIALYRAKEQGRRRLVIADESTTLTP